MCASQVKPYIYNNIQEEALQTEGRNEHTWWDVCRRRRSLRISSVAGQPPTDHNNPAGFQRAGKGRINMPCNPNLNGCVLHKWAPNVKQKTQKSNGHNLISCSSLDYWIKKKNPKKLDQPQSSSNGGRTQMQLAETQPVGENRSLSVIQESD